MEKIKDNLHLFVLANLVLTLFTLGMGSNVEKTSVIPINMTHSEIDEKKIRESICRLAISSIKKEELSDYYIHPKLFDHIVTHFNDKYNLKNFHQFFFIIEGREICRIIGKNNKGFVAFNGVVSSDGPLGYRLTSFQAVKPSITQIRDYL